MADAKKPHSGSCEPGKTGSELALQICSSCLEPAVEFTDEGAYVGQVNGRKTTGSEEHY